MFEKNVYIIWKAVEIKHQKVLNKYNETIKDYFCGVIIKGVPWSDEYKKPGTEHYFTSGCN